MSKKIQFSELVERDGLFYLKLSTEVFTGTVVGSQEGELKEGRREGDWTSWYDNGQIMWKGYYSKGELGDFESWHENGQKKMYASYYNGGEVLQKVEYDEAGEVMSVLHVSPNDSDFFK